MTRALALAPFLAACLTVGPADGDDDAGADAAADAGAGGEDGGAGADAAGDAATGDGCPYPLQGSETNRVGDTLKVFDIRSCEDQPLNTRAFACEGKVFLFVVAANWCTICQSEMPELQRLHNAYADDGLRLLVVTVADRFNRPPTAADCVWWRDNSTSAPLTFPVAFDPTQSAGAGISHVPLTILADRAGTVRFRHEAAAPTDLEARIVALLAE